MVTAAAVEEDAVEAEVAAVAAEVVEVAVVAALEEVVDPGCKVCLKSTR